AGQARRLERIVRMPLVASKLTDDDFLMVPYHGLAITSNASIVVDTFLDTVSVGQTIVVCDWTEKQPSAVVSAVRSHEPNEWEVAPGMKQRVSKIAFDGPSGWPVTGAALSVYIVDAGESALDYELPQE